MKISFYKHKFFVAVKKRFKNDSYIENISNYVELDKTLPENISDNLNNIKLILGNYVKDKKLFRIFFTTPSEVNKVPNNNLRIIVAKGLDLDSYEQVSREISFNPEGVNESSSFRQIFKQVTDMTSILLSGRLKKRFNKV